MRHLQSYRARWLSVAVCLDVVVAMAACRSVEDPAPLQQQPDEAGSDADVGDAGPAKDAATALDCTPSTATGAPHDLACTGLYAQLSTKVVATDVHAFEPGLRLWSDGASKSRWVYLPPGSKIDTSNVDEWVFPVGTKFWKEFSLAGKRVETRLLLKRPDATWLRTVYRWSADETAATELPDGEKNAVGTYEVPAATHCRLCHQGRIDGVLGFEAAGLSSPNAKGLTLDRLTALGLITTPVAPLVVPGNAKEKAALEWLHANCGTACHNRSPLAVTAYIGLYLRLDAKTLGSVTTTDAYVTAVGYPSFFQPQDGGALMARVTPQQPDRSTLVIRASTRDDALAIQMPPLATHVVDDAGVQLLRDWIGGM